MRLAVPIRAAETVTGVLAVDAKDEQSLSENDRYLLGLLAGFAGVALSNARLVEHLREESHPADPGAPAQVGQAPGLAVSAAEAERISGELRNLAAAAQVCLLYTSDAADDLPCVEFGGRRIIKKKKQS